MRPFRRDMANDQDMREADETTRQDLFAKSPWAAVSPADIGVADTVPTMLSAQECQLYHWVGRKAMGLGATVDLGTFAGGSAARLLSGLALSGNPYHLHAFDRFTAAPNVQRRFLRNVVTPTDASMDILPLAQRLLAPWAPHVTFLPGDMTERDWAAGPIEILAYDAGKNARTTDHIAATFFPALIPGKSLILHQDFLLPNVPWLSAQTALLARHMQPLARVGKDCMVFLWTTPVAATEIAFARVAELSDDDLIKLVCQMADTLSGFAEKSVFMAMIQRINANPGARSDWQLKATAGS